MTDSPVPWEPDWSIHPGEALAELLAEHKLTQVWLATHTDTTTKHVNTVIKGKASITPTFAVAVAKALGKQRGLARTLARMQVDHDVFVAWSRIKAS